MPQSVLLCGNEPNREVKTEDHPPAKQIEENLSDEIPIEELLAWQLTMEAVKRILPMTDCENLAYVLEVSKYKWSWVT